MRLARRSPPAQGLHPVQQPQEAAAQATLLRWPAAPAPQRALHSRLRRARARDLGLLPRLALPCRPSHPSGSLPQPLNTNANLILGHRQKWMTHSIRLFQTCQEYLAEKEMWQQGDVTHLASLWAGPCLACWAAPGALLLPAAAAFPVSLLQRMARRWCQTGRAPHSVLGLEPAQ